MVVDYNNPANYRFEWNKGWQPWCRSREMENFFKWLAAIFGTIGIIIVRKNKALDKPLSLFSLIFEQKMPILGLKMLILSRKFPF